MQETPPRTLTKTISLVAIVLMLLAGFMTSPANAQTRPASEHAIIPEMGTKHIPFRRIVPANPPTAQEGRIYPWWEAPKYLGQKITIVAEVTRTGMTRTGSICFLNFIDSPNRQVFNVPIFSDAFDGIPGSPDRYFRNQKVKVTGYVTTYRTQPQITVNEASQIELYRGSIPTMPTTVRRALMQVPQEVSYYPTQDRMPVLADSVPWQSITPKHNGQTLKVKGKVTGTKDIGNLTFINFTSDRSKFYGVVFKDNYGEFPGGPERWFANKTIELTGEVSLHRGRPQMKIAAMGQVNVIAP